MTHAPDQPHPLVIPDPDLIRAEIDAADERARLLRRLLRISLRLHLTTTKRHVTCQPRSGGARPCANNKRTGRARLCRSDRTHQANRGERGAWKKC